jgi:hypothetical protein
METKHSLSARIGTEISQAEVELKSLGTRLPKFACFQQSEEKQKRPEHHEGNPGERSDDGSDGKQVDKESSAKGAGHRFDWFATGVIVRTIEPMAGVWWF